MTGIFTIFLNNSDTEHQTISYNGIDHKLYSPAIDQPLGTTPLNTILDAEDFCHTTWGIDRSGVWDLQWIKRT